MKKIAILGILGIFFAAATMTALYLMFSGPRMKEQDKIVPYRAVIKPLPEGVVPVVSLYQAVPDGNEAAGMTNPVEPNSANLQRGRVYYGHYCAFCHGPKGDGQGTVGQSYMPAPTNLAADKLRKMSDGELYRAMLVGIGHEPVLEYTVDGDKRWCIVRWVRQLQSNAEPAGR